MQNTLSALVALAVLVPFGDAAFVGFLGPRKASALTQVKEMPITNHQKEAGGDYQKGSPLFAKQEGLGDKGKTAAALKEPKSADGKKVLHVTQPPQEEATNHKYWWKVYGGEKNHMKYGLSYFFSYFIFTMLVALIWIKCAKPGRTKEGYDERKNNGSVFAYGLFSLDHCFGHHAHVCLCSWCCAPLRLADTWNKEPNTLVKSFWSALIIVSCLAGLSQLTFGFTSLLLVCVCIHFRQQMRKKYGLESGGSTWAYDCMSWFFCPFCSMAQEARQVEFVLPAKKTVS